MVNTNQKGFSILMVLIVIGLTSIVLIQLSQLNKNPTKQLTQTNIVSKKENPQIEQKKTPSDVKTQTDKIQKYLITEAALLGVADNLSLYFIDVNNPDVTVSLDPSKSWIPASTIKSYVLLEAFRQKRLGLINFDQTISINASNVVSTELESDEFPRLREGTKVSIKQLVEAMIIQSDNTAYNTLLDILDRRNINNSLKNIGITETVVGEKLNLDGEQFQKDLTIPGRQLNTTTVKDLATYFDLLYSQKIPDSQEILNIFKRQKINNMIPAKLPENTIVAHKTGDWAPIYHDGGIVYKPNNPFIFVAFTNSGDPSIIAKLAQVAYFQDAKYVGKNITVTTPIKKNLASVQKPIYSFTPNEQVLGLNTSNKFPDVTAEDLGITSKDLIPDSRQIDNVASAWITPGSVFYSFKRLFEESELKLATNNTQRSKAYLNLANNRLSEIKALLSKGDVSKNDQLLSEALVDIKNATDLAKNDPQKKSPIIEIKKTNDLIFAVMAEKAANLPDNKKEQFVDSVYNFYQRSKKEISPVINSNVVISPTQQKPTIGIIDQISADKVTLKLDDGSTKQVNMSSATNVRSVYQETTEDLSKLKKGSKVAVLGPAGQGKTINAQFILNNVPQELTDQRKGTAIEVNPNTKIIKVIDQKGQVNLVKVDDNTAVKSKDTNVSLEGIKAGSQVVIFGVPNAIDNSKSSPKPELSPNASPQNKKDSETLKLKPTQTSAPAAVNPNNKKQEIKKDKTSQNTSVEIKATSITIVGNSSGKNETKATPVSNQGSPTQSNSPQNSSGSNNSSGDDRSSSSNKKDSIKKESQVSKDDSSKKDSKK